MTRIIGEHFKEDGKPKRGFLSKDQAERFVVEHSIDNVVIYPCTFCGKFHLATDRKVKDG